MILCIVRVILVHITLKKSYGLKNEKAKVNDFDNSDVVERKWGYVKTAVNDIAGRRTPVNQQAMEEQRTNNKAVNQEAMGL